MSFYVPLPPKVFLVESLLPLAPKQPRQAGPSHLLAPPSSASIPHLGGLAVTLGPYEWWRALSWS